MLQLPVSTRINNLVETKPVINVKESTYKSFTSSSQDCTPLCILGIFTATVRPFHFPFHTSYVGRTKLLENRCGQVQLKRIPQTLHSLFSPLTEHRLMRSFVTGVKKRLDQGKIHCSFLRNCRTNQTKYTVQGNALQPQIQFVFLSLLSHNAEYNLGSLFDYYPEGEASGWEWSLWNSLQGSLRRPRSGSKDSPDLEERGDDVISTRNQLQQKVGLD